ncbi:hypothetical protein HanXRQr2_Chr06g0264181 [Helianthus annuus]|uniref:Uncharacterized protein n=1 Tax=Helianthus annuus TaxID=4232 RepID=A0A251UIR4_HELAN|nr:hypothetical protein HanXRQr2_Chr06g0264181 [Helianthus annuus]KAJ0915864.1 hypothetical protein HanPSC8_Chr06g0254831 [Helianthus annuus]
MFVREHNMWFLTIERSGGSSLHICALIFFKEIGDPMKLALCMRSCSLTQMWA